MIKELDTVVLAKDLKEHQLTRGDVGAVVHVCMKVEKPTKWSS